MDHKSNIKAKVTEEQRRIFLLLEGRQRVLRTQKVITIKRKTLTNLTSTKFKTIDHQNTSLRKKIRNQGLGTQ